MEKRSRSFGKHRPLKKGENMKKKFSYIYEISVDNLEISEKMRYYSTMKNAVEVAEKLACEVFRRYYGSDFEYGLYTNYDENPIQILVHREPEYVGQQINARVKRVPVNETIEGKEIKIYWD